MALGTTLTNVLDVTTSAGLQNLQHTTAGLAAVQAAVDSSGTLTVCLMGYHHDYGNNAPTQDGDHTQIKVWYTELGGGYRPYVSIIQGAGDTNVYAEDSGTDDDSYAGNYTFDGGVSYATIRGDSTTTGTQFRSSGAYANFGVFTIKFTGRGSDIVTQNVRSYFVYDLSGIAGTVDAARFSFYIDNVGHTNDDFGKVVLVQATTLAGDASDFGNCFVADAVVAADNATFFGANF